MSDRQTRRGFIEISAGTPRLKPQSITAPKTAGNGSTDARKRQAPSKYEMHSAEYILFGGKYPCVELSDMSDPRSAPTSY